MQKLASAQLTPARTLLGLLVFGALTMLQLLPFHSSIRIVTLELLEYWYPAAMQKLVLVQLNPVRKFTVLAVIGEAITLQ